jgi:hypothetical protein
LEIDEEKRGEGAGRIKSKSAEGGKVKTEKNGNTVEQILCSSPEDVTKKNHEDGALSGSGGSGQLNAGVFGPYRHIGARIVGFAPGEYVTPTCPTIGCIVCVFLWFYNIFAGTGHG